MKFLILKLQGNMNQKVFELFRWRDQGPVGPILLVCVDQNKT